MRCEESGRVLCLCWVWIRRVRRRGTIFVGEYIDPTHLGLYDRHATEAVSYLGNVKKAWEVRTLLS